ncbi:MAG: F0F1 ATP synthase subunit gamma [Candidatus Scalindua sp. AMX11]|nr:MAG: F0F1 ATP synthase subunit gamma [Candidatus Scalindua sp.]NOG84698.1 F0F1 ATP synthase subunit gamma [Planctomycetota bacterium]RZV98310.1 MAG: F0F1 ATP synthase subunit gamma [Candidatus Scalindua sp. SCAELEC01]TDE66597.1 MAG: F0F1 ATP synthase subunit gamma [Candidatus Scalindua sp. AMX11]GJQ58973.1 MAG: ATP synthase subunit gamma [Candidatus Scalindua sp.]
MQTIETIRRNITSAEDLRDIVKTMRTLSAVNIHHFEKAVESTGDYYRSVEMGFQVVLSGVTLEALEQKEERKCGLYSVVFGSDQGLCGGFNEQISDYAVTLIKSLNAEVDSPMVCIGTRTLASLEERKQKVSDLFTLPGSLAGVTPMVQQIVMAITDLQASGKINRVILIHHKLLSQFSYRPHYVTLLPIDRTWIESTRKKKWPGRSLPSCTMDRDTLFSSLFRQYVFISMYRAFAESMACENAARFLSMQSAEKNIEERLEQLNAIYRSERQSSITSELLDIVSGFEALRTKEE